MIQTIRGLAHSQSLTYPCIVWYIILLFPKLGFIIIICNGNYFY